MKHKVVVEVYETADVHEANEILKQPDWIYNGSYISNERMVYCFCRREEREAKPVVYD